MTETGRVLVVGPATRAALPRLPRGTRIRALRFEPFAVRTAFGVDAEELTDRTLSLDAVVGDRAARRLAEGVWTGAGELLSRWRDLRPDRVTAGIVRALTAPGARGVDAVAERAGFSPRHVRRLVRAETGLSPKTLHRVARLHEFLRRAEDERATLGAAAMAAGYADQPHASREIRVLTGLTPGRLLAERRRALPR